jgi:hypothetical protein
MYNLIWECCLSRWDTLREDYGWRRILLCGEPNWREILFAEYRAKFIAAGEVPWLSSPGRFQTKVASNRERKGSSKWCAANVRSIGSDSLGFCSLQDCVAIPSTAPLPRLQLRPSRFLYRRHVSPRS